MNKEDTKEQHPHHEAEVCTCGLYLDASSSQPAESLLGQPSSAKAIDASFVHLPYQPAEVDEGYSTARKQRLVPFSHAACSSFLDTAQHLEELNRAALNGGDGVELCKDCINRVANALDADSERLLNECFMYDQAASKEEERLASLEKALSAVVIGSENSGSQNPSNLQKAEQAFLDEIGALEEECQQLEAELSHLHTLKEEQLNLAKEIEETEYELEVERNSLELEARAFDTNQEQLSQILQNINDEVDKLSSGISLPSVLLDLQVDERGLRYALINELRLAYRPKGDLKWNEVQVAWSLAAQLLLVVGTLFQYPSEQWKIVPLSHCAKLIFYSNNEDSANVSHDTEQDTKRAVVYHLGHPRTNGATAIRAWNRVLHQVILHVRHKVEVEVPNVDMTTNFPNLPFEISPTTIGTIDLNQLNENDNAGWSKAIHFMASNLLWLSECAAIYTSQQVLWTSAVLETFKA